MSAIRRVITGVSGSPRSLPALRYAAALVARGEAGQVLVHTASRPGDPLVIGTGRQGSLGRWTGGAVSRYCLAHAECPVLAIPPSPLELEAKRGWHAWVFRYRGLNASEMTPSASGDPPR